MALKPILQQQREWAQSQWPGHNSVCAPSIDANLFRPLQGAAWKEFAEASGNELGLGGGTPKMSSLRSSSALAYNVFHAWRNEGLASLAKGLSLKGAFSALRFEEKCPHGLGSFPPNLDVVLCSSKGTVGIESKFTEPYGNKKNHPPLDHKYFENHPGRWKEWQLTICQEIAESVEHGRYKRLAVGQLLKHVLGLAHLHNSGKGLCLLYIWYDAGTSEADEHRDEVVRFSAALGQEIDFRSMTYQDLYQRLRNEPEPMEGYLAYLGSRYFSN